MEAGLLGHAMAGHDGIISDVDPNFCEIVGMVPAQIVGRHILDITHPSDRERTRVAIQRLKLEKQSFWMDKRYQCQAGKTVAVRNHVSHFADGDGAIRLIAATQRRDVAPEQCPDQLRSLSIFEALDAMAKASH